ncbi:hypothetical protein KB681_gp37 [Burkholderia phage Mica]|uniref:Putative membrane protein n=1 Tax=Burkholderia phage Mica TaxID=2767579 RepID=A0A873WKS7_9CAUD|nr:hypothetical protein KB681_gp37 [Burkholderia phage Mica]QPB08675.1 putative membrane protein [Burkholderia phage Mica]
MTLHWPQIVYLALSLIGIGVQCAKHGKPREGKENVFGTLFATAVVCWLLYAGGFFG